ncbi:MAG: IPT/TIG domain-containing protein [bacterium]
MSNKYKKIFAFMIVIMVLHISGLSARGACDQMHFDLRPNMNPEWMPSPGSADIMDITGTLTIDQQVRTGDEIGVFYQGFLCGATCIDRFDGSFLINIFNYNAIINNKGPRIGNALEIRLWDAKKGIELTSGFQVSILSSTVKDASGRLTWKHNDDEPWRVDISYNSLVMVTKVEPNENYADRSQEITITGTNYAAGARVRIGSTELSQVSYINGTTLKATVPARLLPVGTYDVTVIVGERSGTLPNGYKVLPAPVSVTKIEPNENYSDLTREITITGSGFAAGAIVKIGTLELTQVNYINTATLKVTVPAQYLSVGTYDLTVIIGSTSTTVPNGFKVLPSATPRPAKLTPDNGSNEQVVLVWIIGSNLFSGSQVTLGTTPLKVTGYSGDVIIYAEIPAGLSAGSYPITVTTSAGLVGVLPDAYTVRSAPVSVTGVDPNKCFNNQSQEITITGKSFSSESKVTIGSQELTQVSFVNTTTLRAIVPADFLQVGIYDLAVTAGGTTGSLPKGFTIQLGPEERVSLTRGLNLICYPVTVPSSYISYDFLTQYFTPQSLQSLWHYDNQSEQWQVAYWNGQSPAGDIFTINNGDGYLVYSKVHQDLVFPGMNASFETNLYQGINLVSFSVPSASFTSFDLLQEMLDRQVEVVAIQRHEKTSGRWYIAFCQSGKPAGDNFPIYKDESYIIYMKKDKLAFLP